MIVSQLKINNLRAIKTAEFNFKPGFNLIVGINGVGKTSVIDALSVCLSSIVKDSNKINIKTHSLSNDDIRVGTNSVGVECKVIISNKDYTYIIHKPRELFIPKKEKTDFQRDLVINTPMKTGFIGDIPNALILDVSESKPFALLFSTRRAIPSERLISKGKAAGGVKAAYADAYVNRELKLGEFAEWMYVQKMLGEETLFPVNILTSIDKAVNRFLPNYSDLRVNKESKKPILLIDCKNKTLDVRQLSDGERGVLALIFDLTKRLSQANPMMSDPAAEAEAVVLIDEIDLHLHPLWQRQIVKHLTEVFPKCQFIATTHSPQIIGEVKNDRIHIMSHGQIYSPTHSYGVDSSRVLEEIMDSNSRNKDIQKLLDEISDKISIKEYDEAKALLDRLTSLIGENDPEVTRIKTLLSFMLE
jgi:predicted ATP-binding protein involved in virulence